MTFRLLDRILQDLNVDVWHTAVSTKVVQKSVKACATMPKGSLGNTQYIFINRLKAQNPFCFF